MEEVELPTDTDMDTDVVSSSTRIEKIGRGGRKRKPPSWQIGYDIDSSSSSSSSAATAAATTPSKKGPWTCQKCGKDTFQSKAGYVTHAKFCSRGGRGSVKSNINKANSSTNNAVEAGEEQVPDAGGGAASPQHNPRTTPQTAVERNNDDGGSANNSTNVNNANLLDNLTCRTCHKNGFKSKGGYATHVKFCGNKGGGAGKRKSTSPAAAGVGRNGNGRSPTPKSKIQKSSSSSSSSIKRSSGNSDSDSCWTCESCGKSFKLKSGYVIHSKFCGSSDGSRTGGGGTNNYGGAVAADGNRHNWDGFMTSCPNCGRDNFKSNSGYALHVKFCDGVARKKRRSGSSNAKRVAFHRRPHESNFSSELNFQTQTFFDDDHLSRTGPMTTTTDNENIDDLWETPLIPPGNVVENDHEWLLGDFCRPVVTPNEKDTESVLSQCSNSALAAQPNPSLSTSSSISTISLPDIRFNGRRDLHESVTPANAEARPCVYCDYKHHKDASDSASALSNSFGANKPHPPTSRISYVKDRCMVCVLPICKDHFDVFHDPNVFHPKVAVAKTVRKATTMTTKEPSTLAAGVTPFQFSDDSNISAQMDAELGMDGTGFSPIPVYNTTRHASGNGGVAPTFSWSDDQQILPTDFILEDTLQPSHGILGSDDFAVPWSLTTGATNQTDI